jgi:hypothetical protein
LKNFTAALLLSCLLSLSVAPVLADSTASQTNAQKSSSNKSVPTRILGAIVGTFVGTPVCFIRRSVWDEKEGVRGIVGDTNNKLAVVSAGAFWLPFGITTGLLEAPCYSFKHSMCNTDKPFSKEQFSLGEQVD